MENIHSQQVLGSHNDEHSAAVFSYCVLMALCDRPNQNPSSWMLNDPVWLLVYPEHHQHASRRA